MAPGTVFATHYELSHLASQIELVSGQLAADLRYTRNYGSVRQRAVMLNREASQLVDTLRRNRSGSRVRSQFKDVRRGYEKLEQVFSEQIGAIVCRSYIAKKPVKQSLWQPQR